MLKAHRLEISIVAGIVVTFLVMVFAGASEDESLVRVLSWPNTLMQSMVPRQNMGTEAEPFYEGTPLNLFALLASIPLSVLFYSILVYAALRFVTRRS